MGPQAPLNLLIDPAFSVFNNGACWGGKEEMQDFRKDNKPGFWQLSWQDLTYLTVTPEVLSEDSHQEREHVLAVGTLSTDQECVETCPSLHPSCHAQFVRRWGTGGGDCFSSEEVKFPLLVMAVVDWQDLGPPKGSEKPVITTWEVLQVGRWCASR